MSSLLHGAKTCKHRDPITCHRARRSEHAPLGRRPISQCVRDGLNHILLGSNVIYANGMQTLSDILGEQTLKRSRYTTHWEPMRVDRNAIRYKERRCQYVADLVDAKDKRIVDFGSGTGLLACYLGKFGGAREVTGVEIVPEHLEFARYLAADVFQVPNVTFAQTFDVENRSRDALILANVVTHIYRPLELLARMRDALKPGGLLFIEDNNNVASPLVARQMRRIWTSEDEVYALRRIGGRRTYGMTAEQANYWAERFDAPSLNGYAPLDPDLNIYHENAFHPRDLAHSLFSIGFAVRSVRPKFVFDFKSNIPVSLAFRHLSKLAIFIAPAYEVLAVKV
jgi:SAM-dependent methyltransferase